MSTPPPSIQPYATFASAPQRGELQRAMLLILTLTLAATCLLTSAPSGISEAGAKPWSRNSILRIITELTNLDYQFPTARGTEIKFYTQGLGAAAALVCAAAAWFIRTRQDPDDELESLPVEAPRPFAWLTGMSPVTAAQLALLLYVGWTMFSAFWAISSESAFYEGLRGLMVALLAIAIARCLTGDSPYHGAAFMTIVLILSAGLGVWYHYERNPLQRLKYPIGNPIFLAACLLPALTLIPALVVSVVLRPRRKAKGHDSSGTQWLTIGAWILGFILVARAFVLAESRGPGLALVLGLVLTAVLLISGRRRWWILGSCLAVLVALILVRRGPVAWILSRPDTIRGRLYCWNYALQIFRQRVDIGRGQGAYMLLGQSLSRPDAENDPLAFPGELIGHAHNEYLEIMADLGAIGLGLFLTAIVVTIWAVRGAWRREESVKRRCVLAGLTAGWLCMLFESGTDVGLRMPGLPVVFYATWGLLWALCRSDSERAHPPRPKFIRVCGLGLAIAAGSGILAVATIDWQGALADPAIGKYASQLQWDKALNSAAQAAQHRLYLEGTLSALYQAARVARDAASHRVGQLREMVQRGEPGGRDQASVMRLAREDVDAFVQYFGVGIGMARRFLNECPAYPNVSGFASDQWVMWAQVSDIQEQIGPIGLPPAQDSPLVQARTWLEYEYAANRLRPEIGLRLLSLSEDQPILLRLDLLRVPMRSGPIEAGVETAMAVLTQDAKFGPALEAMLSYAQPAVQGVTPWRDPYAPETLRVAGVAHKLRGDFELAAAMSGEAARLLDTIRDRFPTNSAYAMADEAGYLLLGDPAHAERAVGAMQQAIKRWPPNGDGRIKDAFRRLLAVYQVAAGHEAEALEIIQSIAAEKLSPEAVQEALGAAYADLCQRFLQIRADHRGPRFKDWLQRALVLAPSWPPTRIVAATVTLEQGQDRLAVENLKALEDAMQSGDQMATILRSLLTRFPNAPALREFAMKRVPELAASTQPDSGLPASRPSGSQPTSRSWFESLFALPSSHPAE